MKLTARTHQGLVRPSNQDSLLQSGALFGVADGMGGHNGGETASRLAVENITRFLKGKKPGAEVLSGAFDCANRRVYETGMRDVSLRGMGTTATVLWEDTAGGRMLIGHVGDSRAYLFHEGQLIQETIDHSFVQELVDQGLITKAEAAVHPYRNVITRAVGTRPGILTDIYDLPLCPGDLWLVCSDGLYGMISDEEIRDILAGRESEEAAADELLKQALAVGGTDNITFILALVEEVGA